MDDGVEALAVLGLDVAQVEAQLGRLVGWAHEVAFVVETRIQPDHLVSPARSDEKRKRFTPSCTLYGAGGDGFLDETVAFNPVTACGESKVRLSRRSRSSRTTYVGAQAPRDAIAVALRR